MARIRTIKPEFPHSESMGRVSRDARLTFIELWTLADDAGRLRGNSRMLASLLFPYDDDAKKLIEGWLVELERERCIDRYVIDETSYIQIRNWLEHQKIDKPSPSKLPEFNESSRTVSKSLESSRDVVGGSGSGSGSGSRKGREGTKGAGAPVGVATPEEPDPPNLDLQAAARFIAYRKTRKPAIRPESMGAFKRELAKFGDRQSEVVEHSIANGYQGLIEPKGVNGARPLDPVRRWEPPEDDEHATV